MRGVHVLAFCALVSIGGAANAQEIDWKKVDEAIGRSATVSGDVHRYGFPRSDLNVTLDGVTIRSALALGGWTAFKPMHGGTMIMGDLVLLETEINPVMSKLIENGAEITAVHNHLLRANPATFYMHVGGPRPAFERHRGDRAAQPHARRAAATVLHAFLGQWRCTKAGPWPACSARQDRKREELNIRQKRWDALVAVIPGRRPISGLPEIGNIKGPSWQQPTWDAADPEPITPGLWVMDSGSRPSASVGTTPI
jgi:hypothetical protein